MSEFEDTPDELWAQVQRALDERRDPLQDSRVQELLVEAPQRLRALELLLERIPRIGVPAQPRRVRRSAAAQALVISTAAMLIFWLARGSAPGVASPRPPDERVIRFKFELTTETPEHTSSSVLTEGGITTTSRFHQDPLTLATLTSERSSTHQP